LTDSVFCRERFSEYLGEDLALMLEIVSLAREDLTNQMKQFEEALLCSDWTKVGRIAHAIKGVCLNICADDCQLAARDIEEVLEAKAIPEAQSLDALRAAFLDLMEALSAFWDEYN